MSKILVAYYSSTGTVHALAKAIAEGAASAGAEVRLRRAAELAPAAAVQANPTWAAHAAATADVPVVEVDDLQWADGFALGSPTRFGNMAAQLKQFIDTTGPLWQEGQLVDKVATAFTAAHNVNGGMETTTASLMNVFHHWGAIVVAPGYSDPLLFAAGGNPYGVGWASSRGAPDDAALAAARHQGARLTAVTDRLVGLASPGGLA